MKVRFRTRTSEEELANMKAGTPKFETWGGERGYRVGGYQLSAFRSCAKQLGLPVELVLRGAETGQLAKMIEKRNGRNAEQRAAQHNLTRRDVLYRRAELMTKLVPPWA